MEDKNVDSSAVRGFHAKVIIIDEPYSYSQFTRRGTDCTFGDNVGYITHSGLNYYGNYVGEKEEPCVHGILKIKNPIQKKNGKKTKITIYDRFGTLTDVFLSQKTYQKCECCKNHMEKEQNDDFKKCFHCQNELIDACEKSNVEKVKNILNNIFLEVNVNVERNDGYTSLMIACENENVEIVKLLLNDPRTKPNQCNISHLGINALTLACEKDNLTIVSLLLSHPKIDYTKLMLFNKPFVIACKNQSLAMFDLLDKVRPEGTVDFSIASSEMLYYVCKGKNIELATRVITHPFIKHINHRTVYDGKSPLLIASDYGNFHAVRLLLEKKEIDVNKEDRQSNNAIILAIQRRCSDIAKLIIEDSRFVIKSYQYKSLIDRICAFSQLDVLKLLVEKKMIDLNKTAYFGEKIFQTAARYGQISILEYLITQKVDINAVDSDGGTALTSATINDRVDILKLLLKQPELEINPPNTNVNNALNLACYSSSQETIKLLLSHKDIDVNAQDKFGQTPLMRSIQRENRLTTQILFEDRRLRFDVKYIVEWLVESYIKYQGKHRIYYLLEINNIDKNKYDLTKQEDVDQLIQELTPRYTPTKN